MNKSSTSKRVSSAYEEAELSENERHGRLPQIGEVYGDLHGKYYQNMSEVDRIYHENKRIMRALNNIQASRTVLPKKSSVSNRLPKQYYFQKEQQQRAHKENQRIYERLANSKPSKEILNSISSQKKMRPISQKANFQDRVRKHILPPRQHTISVLQRPPRDARPFDSLSPRSKSQNLDHGYAKHQHNSSMRMLTDHTDAQDSDDELRRQFRRWHGASLRTQLSERNMNMDQSLLDLRRQQQQLTKILGQTILGAQPTAEDIQRQVLGLQRPKLLARGVHRPQFKPIMSPIYSQKYESQTQTNSSMNQSKAPKQRNFEDFTLDQ